MYRLATLVTSLVLGVAVCSPWALSAHAAQPVPQPGPSFIVQPESDQPAGEIKQGYFRLPLRPGQVRTMRLVIQNTGNSPLTVRSYPVDGVQFATGGVGYSTGAAHLRGPGAWIRMDPHTIVLAPGMTQRVIATIQAPRHVLPGDHVGGLALEDARVLNQGRGSRVVIAVHYRRVIAVVATTPGARLARLRIDGATLQSSGADSQARVSLRNTGTVLSRGAGTLEIQASHASSRVQSFPVDTLLPQAASHVVVPLPHLRLQPGTYALTIRVVSTDRRLRTTWHGSVVVAPPSGAPVPAKDVVLRPIRPFAQAVQGNLLLWIGIGLLALGGSIALGVIGGLRLARRASAQRRSETEHVGPPSRSE